MSKDVSFGLSVVVTEAGYYVSGLLLLSLIFLRDHVLSILCNVQKHTVFTAVPSIGGIAVTGQHFTMEDDSVIVVEESKRFEFESLKFTCRIVREIHCCICRAPVREIFKKKKNISIVRVFHFYEY